MIEHRHNFELGRHLYRLDGQVGWDCYVDVVRPDGTNWMHRVAENVTSEAAEDWLKGKALA